MYSNRNRSEGGNVKQASGRIGQENNYVRLGHAGMIVADYDQNGTVDDVTDTSVRDKLVEYRLRVQRPGAILLANLDIDGPKRIPVAGQITHLDCGDAEINGLNDNELTSVTIREWIKSGEGTVAANKAELKVQVTDAKRIRVFHKGDKSPVMGTIGQYVQGSWRPQTATYIVPVQLTTNAWKYELQIEALTLPGDPVNSGPTGPEGRADVVSPDKPKPYPPAICPSYPKRAPGEIWLELLHEGGAQPHDVALFTIAPFLLLSNLQPVQRIYAVYDGHCRGNHGFMYDLAEAYQAPLPADFGTPFILSTSANPDPCCIPNGNLCIINGARYHNDRWIQDEMEIGYCRAPHAQMHVVLHCKRGRGLSKFVDEEMPDKEVGLFDALHGEGVGTDYGGNIEVSPPVSKGTPRLTDPDAGPNVPAHPNAAPFGKILLGDCKSFKVHEHTRNFLLAQKIQPVLPIDTSWLTVGHVDEILSFVPSTDLNSKGFKMLYASVFAMTVLLEEAKKIPLESGRTGLHRGKYADDVYNEHSVEGLLDFKDYNEKIQIRKLTLIRDRLKNGLDMDDRDIIPIPTYFKVPTNPSAQIGEPGNRTVAETVGMVNMLVVGNDLMVPKPFGPRVNATDAETVLKSTFARLRRPTVVPILHRPGTTQTDGHWWWAAEGDKLWDIGLYFAQTDGFRLRDNINAHIKSRTPLLLENVDLARYMFYSIVDHANNSGIDSALTGSSSQDKKFTKWWRVWIPEPKVDLLEAYMYSILTPHGLNVHFIDDWYYHANLGEVHCGTNAKRQPTDLKWWEPAHYHPDDDTTYQVS